MDISPWASNMISHLSHDYGMVLMSVCSAIAGGVIVSLLRDKNEVPQNDSKRQPPSFGWPIIGKTWQLVFDPEAFAKTHDGLWRTQIFGKEMVVVSSAEHTEKIYRGEGRIIAPNTSFMPSHMKDIIGHKSLASVSGDEHKKLRNAFISCFTTSMIKATSENVQSIAERHVKLWSSAGTFDVADAASKVAFEIGTSFIGMDTSNMSDRSKEQFRFNTKAMMEGANSLPIDLGAYSTFGRAKVATKSMQDIMEKALIARRKLTKSLADAGESPPADVLQRLVDLKDEDGQPMDMDTIKENMVLFVIASFETTAATLASFMLCMCRHPAVQERAHKHIAEVLGEESEEFRGDKQIPFEKFHEFEYIDQILLETERVHTPLINAGYRCALKDFELDGFLIKKNTRLHIGTFGRTRNAAYWERPESFEPERFGAPRNEHKIGAGRNSKLTTFGGGSRQCPGKGFANFERKLIAVLALRDYKFSFAGDGEPKVKYDTAMRIDGEFLVRIERRR